MSYHYFVSALISEVEEGAVYQIEDVWDGRQWHKSKKMVPDEASSADGILLLYMYCVMCSRLMCKVSELPMLYNTSVTCVRSKECRQPKRVVFAVLQVNFFPDEKK